MALSLYTRLRERGVLRVAASYAVIGWLVMQIADVAFEPWDVPGWVRRAPLVIVVLGFPIAVVLAWFFEFGERGIERDTAPDVASRPVTHGIRRYADVVIISILAAAVGYFVLRDAGWLGAASRPGAAVEHASLAVLPLVSVGPVTNDYLAEGLSDELRDQFSRMRSLSVISRSSSMAFVGQSLDAVTIAGKLAVATLLEGTIGREGGRIIVSVQLVDGRTGRVLWAERYDRLDKDLLAVQADIANAVVGAVLPRFSASGHQSPPLPTQDPVAYDFYLLGRQHLRKAVDPHEADTVAWADRAETAFRSAIAADPGFAQAHAVLALALMFNDDKLDKRALASYYDSEVMPEVERALQLDPANAQAYLVKGYVLRTTQRPGGSVFYRRAYELDPNNETARSALAAAAMTAGHFDERFRLLMLARDRDPMTLHRHSDAMLSAAFLGRFDQMRTIVAKMLKLFSDDVRANIFACRSVWFSGAQDEALACAARLLAERAGDELVVQRENLLAGDAWEAMGDTAAALRYYDRSAAAGDDDAAERARLLRQDRAAMRQDALRDARELQGRAVSLDDWRTADFLYRVGMPNEALALYRRSGMADLGTLDSNQLPDAMFGYAQMILLLRQNGESEEAAKMLPALLDYTSAAIEHGARYFKLRLLRAQALLLAGLTHEALEQISMAIDGPGAPFPTRWLTEDPVLREMTKDPRFQALVDRLRQRQEETRARLPATFHREGLAWPM
jgi:serine/threonine-protein kinase